MSPHSSEAAPVGRRTRTYWRLVAPLYDSIVRLALPGHAGMVRRLVRDVGEGARVLDLGSGPGTISGALAERANRVDAVDREMAMHREARAKNPSASVSHSLHDATRLGFRDGCFDVVVAANLLHLLPEAGAALAEVRRVLRPEGHAFLPTFCHGQSRSSRLASRLVGLSGFRLSHRFDDAVHSGQRPDDGASNPVVDTDSAVF